MLCDEAGRALQRIAKQHHRRRLRLQPFQQLCVLLAQGRLRRIICYCRGIGYSAAAARWSRWASASWLAWVSRFRLQGSSLGLEYRIGFKCRIRGVGGRTTRAPMQRRTASPGAARIAKQHHRRRLRLQPFQQLCVLLAQGRLRRIICYCRGIGFSAAAARWSRWASASWLAWVSRFRLQGSSLGLECRIGFKCRIREEGRTTRAPMQRRTASPGAVECRTRGF